MNLRLIAIPAALICGLFLRVDPATAGDWLTWGHDAQRTSSVSDESKLSPSNVTRLRLAWTRHLDNEAYRLSALTSPLVAEGIATPRGVRSILYTAGISGTVFALDADTGKPVWTRTLRYSVTPGKWALQGSFLCPNGITATPVIDKAAGLLYLIGGDGALYGLDLATGDIRLGPIPFVAPFSKNWSLNLVDGVIYTTLASGCGGGYSGIYSLDLRDPSHPVRQTLFSDKRQSAGVWGRAGVVVGSNGKVYVTTGDGVSRPESGDYSNSLVAVSGRDLKVLDFFTPKNWPELKAKDLDFASASPVFFNWRQQDLVVAAGKEGLVYLMNAESLGGGTHDTPLYTSPRLGNAKGICCDYFGVWGGISVASDVAGETTVIVPMGGAPAPGAAFPMTNGETPNGSLMAFRVAKGKGGRSVRLEELWKSGDLDMPDPPVIANGLVFTLGNGTRLFYETGLASKWQRSALLWTAGLGAVLVIVVGLRWFGRTRYTKVLNYSVALLGVAALAVLVSGRRPDDETESKIVNHPAVMKVFDIRNGHELFNSGSAITGWSHFTELALSEGRVFAVDHDSNVYCFGLPGDGR